MRATVDARGRVVIPAAIRHALGLRPGPVELTIDGAGLRIDPVAEARFVDDHGSAVLPATGEPLTTEMIRELRLSLQR